MTKFNLTMVEQAAVNGGYDLHDVDFVGEVADRFICQICTKLLREPHLVVCCGQHFCESCLDQWFDYNLGRQGKPCLSCPRCRAKGDDFNHVIHKGLRSEINELKIRCSNHSEGCTWTGELGSLKTHLESESGCGFVLVTCPNMCRQASPFDSATTCVKRKDLQEHITQYCYLRPFQCKYCGLKDTYQAVTGLPLR